MSLLGIPRTIYRLFRPTIQSLFTWNLPWSYRWRLLILQPVSLITCAISTLPWVFTRAYTVEHWTVAPGVTVRALIFKASGSGRKQETSGSRSRELRPLHVDIHGGGFMGGWPEDDAPFCDQLARETGAVVVSVSYRYAPVYPFPAAIDDIDAVMRWLREHAAERLGADPTLMTVGGFSAGGNLALAAAQAEGCHAPAETGFKAATVFCAVIDLRLKPHEKPVPTNVNFPKKDYFAVLSPLYDCYPGPVRAANMTNPRMSPILADVDRLPENLWIGIAGVDILVHEQTTFAERVREDLAKDAKNEGRRVEVVYDIKGFHGYLNLPNSIIPDESKQVMFRPAVQFIKDVHRKYGWWWE